MLMKYSQIVDLSDVNPPTIVPDLDRSLRLGPFSDIRSHAIDSRPDRSEKTGKIFRLRIIIFFQPSPKIPEKWKRNSPRNYRRKTL